MESALKKDRPAEVTRKSKVRRVASGFRPMVWHLLLILVCFVLAAMMLLSLQVNQPIWELPWLNDGTISPELIDALKELRYELSTLTFVLFSLVAYAVLDGRRRATYGTGSVADRVYSTAESSSQRHSIEPAVGDDMDQTQALSDHEQSEAQAVARRQSLMMRDNVANSAVAQLQIATDELSRVRQELKSCRTLLETERRARARFLSNISDEIRTPMTDIVGLLNLLSDHTLPERELRFVSDLGTSASSLLTVVNDLRDVARTESGTLQLEYGRFSVRECLEDVCASLANSANAKGTELTTRVDESVPKSMDGDPERVRQILHQLITNAIAFTHEGEVVVSLRRVHSKYGKSLYKCEVQDTGKGMSKEQQAQLEDIFTEDNIGNRWGKSDIGMGLSLTRQLVSLMNGSITFNSCIGEGSCFSFTMEFDDVADTEVGENSRRSLHGARVLVVDSNETNRTVLYQQLTNWGLNVETVGCGHSALEGLRVAQKRKQGFDFLIVDPQLSGMDGIQLLKDIQNDANLRHIRTIILTTANLPLGRVALRELGIYKYVSKPVRQSVLHDSLASLLQQTEEGALVSVDSGGDGALSGQAAVRVLLIESALADRDSTVNLLEQLGCDVSVGIDGQDVIERAEANQYDMVFINCHLSNMNTFEITRRLKSESGLNASTPIVAVTTCSMNGKRGKCIPSGVDDYVIRPLNLQILSDLISRWTCVNLPDIDPLAAAELSVVALPAGVSQTPALIPNGGREEDLSEDSVQRTSRLLASIPGGLSLRDGSSVTTDGDASVDGAEQDIPLNRMDVLVFGGADEIILDEAPAAREHGETVPDEQERPLLPSHQAIR